jgi:phytoene desaturase
MTTKRVIVIGAGIGGITAAIHLARHGFQVSVVEKNSRPGGRCDRISHEDHHFDTGPTLMVMPLLYESEFSALGTCMHEMLDLQRVDPTYHLIFDDGSQLALTSDLKSLQEQLEAIEPSSFQGLLRYLDEGHRHYNLSIEKLVNPDFRKATDFFKASHIPLLYQVKPLTKHYANMSNYFDDPRLKAAFTFQDVYMGLSPFEASATFSMMPYSELAHGVWYPRGGMYQVVEALMTLAYQAGIEFSFKETVDQIIVNGGRASGIKLRDGKEIKADIILANADLPYVYQNLLPQNGRTNKLDRMRYSCSVISFFWGVDKVYDRIEPHTLFLVDEYRENFESITKDLSLPSNPSLYIHAPARLDSRMAPPGQDTLIAIVPVGHIAENRTQDWPSMRDQARNKVFQRLQGLGIQDLETHIKFEFNFTPLSWQKRYNLVKGSTHGLCHNLTQLAYFRPDLQHPSIANLYFVGASTRPGTGMPTAMVSGRQSAQRIIDNIKN